MKDYSELNSLQIDALKEISNIGAGNAATSLSQMVGRIVEMSVPRAVIAPFPRIVDYVGGADAVVAGGYLHVDGAMPMAILFLMPESQVNYFIDLIFGYAEGTTKEMGEMEQSAFKEIVNILSGSYLNALSIFTRQTYSPTVPALAVDMAGALIGEVLQEIGLMSDHALVVENVFMEREKQIKGHFFLLPEPDTMEALLKLLGVL